MGTKRLRWIVLALYVALMWALIGLRLVPTFSTISVWDAQSTETLVKWGRHLLFGGAVQFAASAFLGFLVGLVVWAPRRVWTASAPRERTTAGASKDANEPFHPGRPGAEHEVVKWLLAILLGLGLGAFLVSVPVMRRPTVIRLVLPWVGCIFGIWFARWWRGGWIGRMGLVVQLVLLTGLVVGGGAWALSQMVEREPLTFTPEKVTSAEKRRLVNLLREGGQRDAEVRCVQLTEYDVNLLLNWGLSIGSEERKAKAVLRDGEVQGTLSIALPWGGYEGSYLNAQASGHLAARDGRVEFSLHRLRLGTLEIPQLLLDMITRTAVNVLEEDADLGEMVRSTRRLTIKTGVVEVIARRGLLEDHIAQRLVARLGAKPEVALATGDYVRHLVDAAPKLPRGDQRFLAFVRAAFQFARDRSAHAQADPVVENRAAILALGILLGHPRVEHLVGNVTDYELRRQAARSIGRVTLRSRHDWTRHFWVSAAIALMSNDLVSDAIGLLKEELDAGRGGSGFSFADLLADMAGTRFALYVTRDAKTARAAQKWLAGEVTVDHLFPPAADLPERIRDGRLQADYGGVGGEGYRKMIAELERRLQSCRFGE